MTTSSRRAAYSTAILYSASQALSSACDVLYSTRREGYRLSAIVATSALAGCIEFFESYAFQGQSIIRAGTDDEEITTAKTQWPYLAMISQLIYFMLNMAITFANRYFLLVAAQDLYELQLRNAWFWSILAIDLVVKQSFAMSNEIYEAYEIFAKKTGYDKPCYASMYRPVASKGAREIFSLVGSLEHVFIDDLLGLVLLLPKKAIHYLAQHFTAKIAAIISGIIVGLPLTGVLLMQAYLFEGAHSRDHLASLIDEEDNFTQSVNITPCRARALKFATNIMAPLHGIASAISVYFALWEDNPIASLLLACLVFMGVTYGVYESEVREGKEALNEMTKASTSEKAPLLVNNQASSINKGTGRDNDFKAALAIIEIDGGMGRREQRDNSSDNEDEYRHMSTFA